MSAAVRKTLWLSADALDSVLRVCISLEVVAAAPFYPLSMMSRTSRPYLGFGEGAPGELMAPRVSWRWKRGRHLCGEISQFPIASGNWQLIVRGAWSIGCRVGRLVVVPVLAVAHESAELSGLRVPQVSASIRSASCPSPDLSPKNTEADIPRTFRGVARRPRSQCRRGRALRAPTTSSKPMPKGSRPPRHDDVLEAHAKRVAPAAP